MKKMTFPFLFFLATVFIVSCTKNQTTIAPVPEPEVKYSYINFIQDTIAVNLSITTARKENVGSFYTTAIEGKLPDSTIRKNNLIIRVTGDSARAYNHTEIFASYTDAVGTTYANAVADTMNKVAITKLQKIKQGIIEGSFTITVSNSTKTKTLKLTGGKFSTSFFD